MPFIQYGTTKKAVNLGMPSQELMDLYAELSVAFEGVHQMRQQSSRNHPYRPRISVAQGLNSVDEAEHVLKDLEKENLQYLEGISATGFILKHFPYIDKRGIQGNSAPDMMFPFTGPQ